MQTKYSLTEGSIWKGMLLFALPVFLGQVFQQFYNAFDSWCVGQFIGDNALAAVSSSGSLIFMMVSFFNGLAMGAGVVIAHHFGAQDYDKVCICTGILSARELLEIALIIVCFIHHVAYVENLYPFL